MSPSDAREAGLLAAALDEIDDQLERIEDDEHASKGPLGLGFSFDHSDSGSSGFGDAIVPRAIAVKAMKSLRFDIVERLNELGVTAEHKL